jgi:hypothetical protein
MPSAMAETAPAWRRQIMFLFAVLALFAAASLFRAYAIEWSGAGPACRAAASPWWCVPRAAVLWVQMQGLFGVAALLAAGGAIWRQTAEVSALAVGFGLIAIVNFNIDEGLIAAAIGALIWLRAVAGRR